MCDVKEKRISSIANSLGYNPNDEVKTYRSFCDKNMLNSNVGSWKIHTFCITDRHTHTHTYGYFIIRIRRTLPENDKVDFIV